MAQIVLIHWNEAEGLERKAKLEAAGHDAEAIQPEGGKGLKRYRAKPPDAFVVDLGRLPSHGRAVGVFLRQTKGTRDVPLVFVDGAPEKVAKVRQVLPDATYAKTWRGIRGAIIKALSTKPKKPIVPQDISGYSGTPLPKKLGIKPNTVLALLGAPKGFDQTLGQLPEGVRIKRSARGFGDVILLFTKSSAELARRLPAAQRSMAKGARLWLAWPKQASGVKTDLNGNVIRATGLASGLMDYKICAIDATWSGLCFSRRKT